MKYLKLLYLFYPLQMLKNISMYLVGTLFYFVSFNQFYYGKFILGMLAFVISYTFVYYLNDFVDYDSDMHDRTSRLKKKLIKSPFFTGVSDTKNLMLFATLILLVGLLLSFWVGGLFLFLVLVVILLNVLHTIPAFKRLPYLVIPNMFLMQLVKFSIGWVAQSASVVLMPLWILAVFAGCYVFTYKIFYKHSFVFGSMTNGEKISLVVMAMLIGFFSIEALFMYGISLPFLVASLLVIPAILLTMISKRLKRRIIISSLQIEIILISFILMLLLTKFSPYFSDINSQISKVLKDNFAIKEIFLFISNTFDTITSYFMLLDYVAFNGACNLTGR